MRNAGVVRPAVAGIVLFAASCVLPSVGAGAGDGAVLNGIHTVRAKALKARPDTSRHALPAASATTRPDVTPWNAPPIDVRALSAAESRSVAEPRPAVEPAQVAQIPRLGTSAARPLVAVAAVLVAACSTALVLFVVARTSRRRSPGPSPEARAPRASEYAVVEQDTPVCGTETVVPVTEEEEDGFFGVGRDLRGSREEMALAMRLHSGAMGDGSRRSARSACSADASSSERVKVARRLGIGRGEIDLALRLQKLESTVNAEVKTA